MKKEIFLLGIIVFILLTSCTSQKKVDEYFISNKEFFTGTSGLEVEFQKGIPPDKIAENNLIDVMLDIHNKGAYYLNGFITLIFEENLMCIVDDGGECVEYDASTVSGINVQEKIREKQTKIVEIYKRLDNINAGRDSGDLNALQAEAKTLREDIKNLKQSIPLTNPMKTKWIGLEGKTFFTPSGENEIVQYMLKTKSLPSLKTKQDTQVIATACYEYATTFTGEVCVDTNINKGSLFKGSCIAKDITSGSQGSPIVIEKVSVKALRDSPQYIRPAWDIQIKNAGNGRVINKEKIEEACSSAGLQTRDYNLVVLDKVILSNAAYQYTFNGLDPITRTERKDENDHDTIECSPNPLILKEGEQSIFHCAIKKGLQDAAFSTDQPPYTTPIQIDLSFGYQFSRTVPVTIEKMS